MENMEIIGRNQLILEEIFSRIDSNFGGCWKYSPFGKYWKIFAIIKNRYEKIFIILEKKILQELIECLEDVRNC